MISIACYIYLFHYLYSLADSFCGAGATDVALGEADARQLENNERNEMEWMEEEKQKRKEKKGYRIERAYEE